MTDIEKARDLVYRFTTDFILQDEYIQLAELLRSNKEARAYALGHKVSFNCRHDEFYEYGVRSWLDQETREIRFKMVPVTGEKL